MLHALFTTVLQKSAARKIEVESYRSPLARHCPQLLFSPTKTIQRKMDMFRQRGVPPELLLNRFPSIFALGDEAIQHRIAFLQHLGLDAKQIAKRGPPVYALSEKNIHTGLHNNPHRLKLGFMSNPSEIRNRNRKSEIETPKKHHEHPECPVSN